MIPTQSQLVIVGGGPAGMMAGLLFARASVETVVLEKHADFLRDFRGDTVHPSTLRIFSELGLLDRLLERPHDKVREITAFVGERQFGVADFSAMNPRWNFIAMMPQWDFLDFVASQANLLSNFTLVMNAEATGLTTDGAHVTGVSYRLEGEQREIASGLVIASDGRRSVLRDASRLPLRSLGAPMDVFWFRIPRKRGPANETTGFFTGGVGINLAIQDAVAAANILAAPMARGVNLDPILARVRARRILQVRAVQAFQNAAQRRIITPLLSRSAAGRPPLALRMLDRFPALRRIPAAFLGFGVRAEHVSSPKASRG